jgi:hypothetical protein
MDRDRQAARRRVARQVRPLLPLVSRPWNVDTFLDRLEALRDEPIDVVAVEYQRGAPSGAWRLRDGRHLIAYPRNTSPLHQDHIILHEIGHMLLDHRGDCTLALDEAQRIAPNLAPAAFAHLLTRVTTELDEYEAELVAVSIITQATMSAPTLYAADQPGSRVAQRIASLIES